ncbi:hypothetical protein L6E12_17940 [Actinokineospora sp. PR83]|uniref:DUF6541 family protein n=1 Tax=Actinokineospora sp. PR83 TaxID=2884908 RepID=UPI001F1692E3|nr:DUF6541 family protein [Actinokineospora sp. PR83]MCG8917668.1 hypothetical protein [Actinokineospora sp. PR83]
MTGTHLLSIGVLGALLLLPGLLVGLAAGLRGWVLFGAAPVATYGVIGVFSPYFPGLLPRWSVWGLLLGTVIAAALLLAVRWAAHRWYGRFQEPVEMPSVWRWQHHVAVAAAVAVAAGVGLLVTYRATGAFTGIHQFWDAMFHVNATRFIADSGQSAPGALRVINAPDNPDFYYPNAYHVLQATVVQITGQPIPDTLNIGGGAFAATLSLGMAALVRVTSGRPALATTTALVSCAVSSFPAGLQFFGPLWPFAAGITVIPSFLALFTVAVRSRALSVLVLTALGTVGLAALHPSAAIAAAVYGIGFLLVRWVAARKVPLRELGALAITGAVAAVYVLPQLIAAARSAGNATVSWPTVAAPGPALGGVFFLNFDVPYPQWWLVLPMLVGLFSIKKLVGLRWILFGGAFFTLLFVVAASYKGFLVRLLTDPWWNDVWRFAGLVALAQIVLIGSGLVVIRDTALRGLSDFRAGLGDARGARVGALAVVLLLLVVLTQGFYRDLNRKVINAAYSNGPTVSELERAAMDELRAEVPPGDLVMNDPLDGSPWMWALDGVRPVFGHALDPAADFKVIGPDRAALFDHFDELDTDERIQDIVRRQRITHVYIGEGFATPTSKRAPGMDDLASVRSLELVFSNAGARIYRVVLPGGTTPG